MVNCWSYLKHFCLDDDRTSTPSWYRHQEDYRTAWIRAGTQVDVRTRRLHMLHYSSKSALMAVLEKLPPRSPDQRGSDRTTTDTVGTHLKVIISDGIAELQCLEKPVWVKNSIHVAEHFVATVDQNYMAGGTRFAWFSTWRAIVTRQSHKRKEARRSGRCLL